MKENQSTVKNSIAKKKLITKRQNDSNAHIPRANSNPRPKRAEERPQTGDTSTQKKNAKTKKKTRTKTIDTNRKAHKNEWALDNVHKQNEKKKANAIEGNSSRKRIKKPDFQRAK